MIRDSQVWFVTSIICLTAKYDLWFWSIVHDSQVWFVTLRYDSWHLITICDSQIWFATHKYDLWLFNYDLWLSSIICGTLSLWELLKSELTYLLTYLLKYDLWNSQVQFMTLKYKSWPSPIEHSAVCVNRRSRPSSILRTPWAGLIRATPQPCSVRIPANMSDRKTKNQSKDIVKKKWPLKRSLAHTLIVQLIYKCIGVNSDHHYRQIFIASDLTLKELTTCLLAYYFLLKDNVCILESKFEKRFLLFFCHNIAIIYHIYYNRNSCFCSPKFYKHINIFETK